MQVQIRRATQDQPAKNDAGSLEPAVAGQTLAGFGAGASDLDTLRERATRFFAGLLWLHVPVIALIAFSNGVDIWRVIMIATVAALIGTFVALRGKGLAARLTMAAALTLGPAVMVYAGRGPWQVDWHMYFFVIFGMLVVYVDWRPIALAAGLTAAHHLLLDIVFPESVFPEAGLGRVVVHAGIVIVDCGALFWLVSLMKRLFAQSAASLKAAQDATAEAQRLESYAKDGSDLIMQAVNQGLLLCDDQYRIQPQYSSELEKIFQTEELAGRDLLQLVQGLIGERLSATTRDFVAMLFDAKKKERTVLKVNPLSEVECSFWDDASRDYTSKFLNFSFRRIVEDGRVVRIFVAVNDITERVKLERQLHEAEQQKERQVELLLSFLNIEPIALEAFIVAAKQQILAMNDTQLAQDFAAASAGNSDHLRKRLDAIVGCLHKIKVDATHIKFEYFQKRADEFESKLAEVRNREALGGDDFLSVVFVQSQIRSDVQELEALRGKFPSGPQRSQIAETVPSNGAARPSEDVVVAVAEFAQSVAQTLGKEVRVDAAAGFDTRHLEDWQREAIKDVLIQLASNSLTHGVDVPELRQVVGKNRHATLTIRPVKAGPGEFAFTFRDDGRGLDIDRIRSRAVEQGTISSRDLRAYDDSRIAALIFEPGFSTAGDAATDSSRGMGMNVVKERIVAECGGDVSVVSEPGLFCEFKITLPLAVLAHA